MVIFQWMVSIQRTGLSLSFQNHMAELFWRGSRLCRLPSCQAPGQAIHTMAENLHFAHLVLGFSANATAAPGTLSSTPAAHPEPATLTLPLNSKMHSIGAPIPNFLFIFSASLYKWAWLMETRSTANSLATKGAGKAALEMNSMWAWRLAKHERVGQGPIRPKTRQMSTTRWTDTSRMT